jgi:hypothetical protein
MPEFGSWTAGWQERAAERKPSKIETVSLPATGVYGVVLCDVLEAAGG